MSYITELVETMTPKGYSVIQPLMRRYAEVVSLTHSSASLLTIYLHFVSSSSYNGYGIHTLEDDCHDIDQLIGMLQNVRALYLFKRA